MGSAKVDVRVMSQGRELDVATSRPVRLIGSELAGVVYAGAVFPLRQGNVIDLSDESYTKESCNAFVEDLQPIPYALEDQASEPEWVGLDDDAWYVETNKWGHYVVFDASEEDAEEVAAVLDQGLGLIRWDASHRVADNGRRYDWFARLSVSPDLDHDSVVAMVRPVLASSESVALTGYEVVVDDLDEPLRSAFRMVWARGSRLDEENEWLKSHAHELHDSAQAITTELDGLRVDHAEVQRDLMRLRAQADRSLGRISGLVEEAKRAATRHDRELSAAASENADLAIRLLQAQSTAQATNDGADVERRIADANDNWAAAEAAHQGAVAQLQAARSEAARASEERDRYEQSVGKLTEEQDFLQEAAARLEQEKEDLTGRIAEFERQSQEERTLRHAGVPNTGKRKSVQEELTRLLQPLQLDEESIVALLDFPQPQVALRWLTRIANKESIEIRAGIHTKVANHPGWWEIHKVHIGDKGNAAAGRIYYQHQQDGAQVRIHRKTDDADQRQYMKRELR